MRESRRDDTRSHVHSFRPRNPHPPDHSRKAAAQCSPARKRWTGAPFKPDFGLSGAFPRLDRPYPLALARSPFGLDSNSSLAASCVMEKAAPRPVFGALPQSLFHWVPMNVMKVLDQTALDCER